MQTTFYKRYELYQQLLFDVPQCKNFWQSVRKGFSGNFMAALLCIDPKSHSSYVIRLQLRAMFIKLYGRTTRNIHSAS